MTLIVALALFSTLGVAWYWYPLAIIAWFFHLAYHESAPTIIGSVAANLKAARTGQRKTD